MFKLAESPSLSDYINLIPVNVRSVGVKAFLPNTGVPKPDAFYVPNLVMADQIALQSHARVPYCFL